MFVPVLVHTVACWHGHGDQPSRLRRPNTGRLDPPPTRGPVSDFGQRFPDAWAMSPRRTPDLAHNALKLQAIARRRAFRKAMLGRRLGLHRRPHVSAPVKKNEKYNQHQTQK
jgi:hypothetical protein